MPTPSPAARPVAPLPVALVPREPPLPASAAVATGAAATALAQRLLAESDQALAALRGLAGDRLLAVLGDERDLPWVDGVLYLGADPDAPRLLLPTALAPSVGVALYETAVLRHLTVAATASPAARGLSTAQFALLTAPPIAVLPPPHDAIFSVATAAPISRPRLVAWLEAHA